MKKLLIIIAILLLGGVGYFTYLKWVKNADITKWSFVPKNSLVVYESPDPLGSFNEIAKTNIWKNFSSLPLFGAMDKNLKVLDTIGGKGNFNRLFENTNILVSLHQISSTDFDFLYVAEIDNLSKHAFISQALIYYRRQNYIKKTRNYLGFTITEIKIPKSVDTFTFIFYKNYFIGSFSAFLVEDGIRTVTGEEIGSFEKEFDELSQITKLKKDEGNLYVNLSKFSLLYNGFFQETTTFSLAKSAFTDLKITDQRINLSGFSFLNNPDEFLSTLTQKPGSSFDMAEVIPMQSASAFHYNFSDPLTFASKLESYLMITEDRVLQARERLLNAHDFDISYTYQLIDEEIGLINLEPMRPNQKDQLLILEVKDMGESLKFFNSVAERKAASTRDTVYVEKFGNYEIRKLPIEEFPAALLGKIAEGFESSFYLQHRNYLIFSNNLLQLKNLTLAIENEDTWSKSLRIKNFLDEANKAANFSVFVNTPRSWSQFVNRLDGSWKDLAKANQFSLRNMEFLSLQFTAVDNKFYTDATLHQSLVPDNNIPEKIDLLESISLPDFIISKPYLISSHNSKEREVVIQDSSYFIHQFSDKLELIWSKDIGEKIISDIQQIDYYKSDKLQIIFSTASGIHVIDRNGEYIPGFPKSISQDRDIDHISIIDYDNSKNYRFAIANTKGDVYLTDKNVKPLKGWSPKTFDSRLIQPPKHYRIGRKDIIVAIEETGKINVLNRRGEFIEKFPIDIKADIKGNVFIKETNELSTSSIHLVTEIGESIELSLTGTVLSRDQLYKPSTKTQFSLVPDVASESFIILRKTEQKYEILSETGSLLFEKDYFSDKPLYPQYYRLGGGVNYVTFVDSGGAYLYTYDMNGSLVTGRPLTATMPIALLKYEDEYQIYRVVDKNLELISVSF